MVTGFSECIDSFFAFGLFALAKRSGFFPPALVDTFEPVMQEEGRHILFFVNWAAWHRASCRGGGARCSLVKTLAVWAFLIWERIGIARGVGASAAGDGAIQRPQDNNFTLTGGKAVAPSTSPATLIEICLAENDRRPAATISACCGPCRAAPGAFRPPSDALRPPSEEWRGGPRPRHENRHGRA